MRGRMQASPSSGHETPQRTGVRWHLLSFVHGASSAPLLFETVDGVLKRAVARCPDRAAVVVCEPSVRYTFRELDAAVERVARGFAACGLEPGERVGIWAPNCSEWLLTLFGAARAGLILVNVNPAYRSYELEYALRLVGCRALVFAPAFKSTDYLAMLQGLLPELCGSQPGLLRSERLPELRLLVRIGNTDVPGCLSFAELEHPQFANFDLTSLRTGIMAGAPCPIAVMRRVITEMHMPEVTICYGMTETSPVSFQSACDDPIERRVSTVGRVHPHVQVKIIDASGCTTPRGVSGELLTRGYSVMRGYWGQPELTAEAIDAAGWMRTGDLAELDEEGYCNIVGRVKDMVIRGGENIYPREIEEFLYRHPAVLDVAVVGVPDRRYGEEICACIRLREGARATEEDIREFCRGQIAHYKVPRYVRFMDGFPQTVTGKIQKYLLREQLQRELGLVADEHA